MSKYKTIYWRLVRVKPQQVQIFGLNHSFSQKGSQINKNKLKKKKNITKSLIKEYHYKKVLKDITVIS
jgi:hypothetical protein